MAISRINQATNFFVQPFASTGTYTLSKPLVPGFYKITTDTTQSLTAAQLYFQTTTGYRFGVVIRGGQGYVAIPLDVEQVVFTTGTFPLLLGMELIPSYGLLAAPTTTNDDVTYYPGGDLSLSVPKMNLAFTAPPTATSVGIYWRNGTFTDLTNTTSPKTDITLAAAVAGAYAFLVVAKDANGVWGLGTELTKPYPWSVITTTSTYTRPAGVTTANVLVVGGGGAGGGTDNSRTRIPAGGGGSGDVIYQTGVSVAASVAVTVGAAGTGTGRQGNSVGQSVFGAITANGGTGGWGYAVHQSGPLANGGPSGAAGRTGGNGVSDQSGGGGGGDGANGTNGVTTTGGNGGVGYTALLSYAFGAGGAGSGEVTAGTAPTGGGAAATGNGGGGAAPNFGGGGGGARFYGSAGGSFGGGNGRAGVVIVEAIF